MTLDIPSELWDNVQHPLWLPILLLTEQLNIYTSYRIKFLKALDVKVWKRMTGL